MTKIEQKRKQALKVIIIEIFMVIGVVVAVGVFMFIVLGYKFSLEDGTIDQSGLLQINSTPTGATISIDGETLFAKTNTSKMLSEGEHTVRLTKDGYELWEKTVTVQPGLLYKLDYPRLFKQNRKKETVENLEDNLMFLSAAPNQTSLLYAEDGELTWEVMSIKGDEATVNEIEVAEFFRVQPEKLEEAEFTGEILGMEWNENGDKVVIEWKDGDVHDFILLNLKNLESSLNLTEEFDMDFSEVKMVGSSAEQLFALENGNLRKISVSEKAVSRVLLSNVESFDNRESTVIYVTKATEAGERVVGLYRDGEKEGFKLTAVKNEVVKAALSEYLGGDYVSLALDGNLRIYRGELPTTEGGLEDMTEVINENLTSTPKELYVHDDGRIIVAQNGRNLAVFDAELTGVTQFTVEDAEFSWLDEFLIGDFADGKLYAEDFDGTNKRELAEATSGYAATISANEKWLYYVTDDGKVIERERL